MEVIVKEVVTSRDLKTFVKLPSRIHKGHTNWIPPIYLDEIDFFNPAKNHSFNYCSHIRLLAYRGDEVVGRIMGLVNHRYNEVKKENNARFSYLETYNDQEVAHALISRVEAWAISMDIKKIVGPLGFSDKEPQGYMVFGFDQPSVLCTNCNYEYQVDLIKNEGYRDEVGLVSYLADIPEEVPPVYKRVLPRIEQLNTEFRMVEFTARLKFRKYVRPVLTLTNRTFKNIYGSMPYEEREMHDFANRFIWLLNPKFVKIVENQDGDVVAFTVAMADLGKGIQKSRGHILPFGIFKILNSGRKSNRLVALLGAIDEQYRGRGLDVMMGLKILESGRKEGKTKLDSHVVMEMNRVMCGEYEHIGGTVYKKFTIFAKELK
jgi:hypothetical protein